MSVDRIDVSAAEKIINQMGLVFAGNQISFSNEKIWLMGPNGQREKLRKDFSAVSLFRFELAQRKSTNAVTGCFRFKSASGKQVAAEAIINGKLHYEYDGKCFDVDTKTMRRFNSPDIFPPFISVEK